MSHPLDSLEVANYLVAYTDREAGETISNLKLLKLVYYAQGFCLAMRGEPLFTETIEAWDNGPVVRAVYDEFKHLAYFSIPAPAGFDPDAYLPEDRELLDAILATYGQLSATRLREMTHEEPPWWEAYRTGNRNEPIAVEAMSQFFKDLVEAGKRGESLPNRPDWPATSFQHQGRRRISDRMERHREALRAIASRFSEKSNPDADYD